MDPITLATVTAAVTSLGLEAAKGAASEAGKTAWTNIKSRFGWKVDPSPDALAHETAQKLHGDDELAERIVEILKQSKAGSSSALVEHITAEKVVVAKAIHGNVNM